MRMKVPLHNPWLRCWQPRPQARLRLFCFPYAGGSASVFRSWPEHVPPEVEVWAVQPPGRESRLSEAPFRRLDALIAALEETLAPYLDRPYAFFGHSMGALVSFELTRAMRRRQRLPGPVRLFASAHRAPQLRDPLPPIHQLPEEAFLRELRRFHGTPDEVLQEAELIQLLLPLLRADFAVCETYTYSPEAPLTCPVSVFGGLKDKDIPTTSIAAWREQTTGPFKLRFFDGDHFFLHSQRANLLQALSQDLLMDLQRL